MVFDYEFDYILIACRQDGDVIKKLRSSGIDEERLVNLDFERLIKNRVSYTHQQACQYIEHYLDQFQGLRSAVDISALVDSTWLSANCMQEATDIMIVSGCDRFRLSSFVNHKIFADLNGASYFWSLSVPKRGGRDGRFHKPYAVLRSLGASKWVLWQDDDAYFTDFEWKLSPYLEQFTEDMIICNGPPNEIGSWAYINNGVFFLRSTPRSATFLKTILETDLSVVNKWWDNEAYGFNANDDQAAFTYVLATDKRFK
jgi:hypothetical protein